MNVYCEPVKNRYIVCNENYYCYDIRATAMDVYLYDILSYRVAPKAKAVTDRVMSYRHAHTDQERTSFFSESLIYKFLRNELQHARGFNILIGNHCLTCAFNKKVFTIRPMLLDTAVVTFTNIRMLKQLNALRHRIPVSIQLYVRMCTQRHLNQIITRCRMGDIIDKRHPCGTDLVQFEIKIPRGIHDFETLKRTTGYQSLRNLLNFVYLFKIFGGIVFPYNLVGGAARSGDLFVPFVLKFRLLELTGISHICNKMEYGEFTDYFRAKPQALSLTTICTLAIRKEIFKYHRNIEQATEQWVIPQKFKNLIRYRTMFDDEKLSELLDLHDVLGHCHPDWL